MQSTYCDQFSPKKRQHVFPPHRRHQTSLTVDWIAGFLYPFFNLGTFAYQSHRRCKSKLFFFFFYFSPLSLNKRLLFLLSFFSPPPFLSFKRRQQKYATSPQKKEKDKGKKEKRTNTNPYSLSLTHVWIENPNQQSVPKGPRDRNTDKRGESKRFSHTYKWENKGGCLVWLSKFMQQRAKKTRLLAPFKSIDPIWTTGKNEAIDQAKKPEKLSPQKPSAFLIPPPSLSPHFLSPEIHESKTERLDRVQCCPLFSPRIFFRESGYIPASDRKVRKALYRSNLYAKWLQQFQLF